MDLFFALNIGVIGGADGPTAIFVSGGPSVWFWVGVGITVVAAVGLFVYWFQNANKTGAIVTAAIKRSRMPLSFQSVPLYA